MLSPLRVIHVHRPRVLRVGRQRVDGFLVAVSFTLIIIARILTKCASSSSSSWLLFITIITMMLVLLLIPSTRRRRHHHPRRRHRRLEFPHLYTKALSFPFLPFKLTVSETLKIKKESRSKRDTQSTTQTPCLRALLVSFKPSWVAPHPPRKERYYSCSLFCLFVCFIISHLCVCMYIYNARVLL